MRNRFWSGVLTGLTASVFLLTLIFTIYFTKIQPQSPVNSGISAQSSSNSDILAKLDIIRSLVDSYYLNDIVDDDWIEGIYKGAINSLDDPYAAYYTEAEFKSQKESAEGVYYGIGTTVSQNMSTGIITIVKPFVDGPAYNAGLLPGDVIYKVNDDEVTGMDLTDVVTKMKGKEGTEVQISVVREGEDDIIELSVARGKIEVPTIEYEMLEDNIGYISILEFDKITIEQFVAAVDTLEQQSEKGLIIDLRDNGGGVLDAAVAMLNRLLPEGLATYTETKDGSREDYATDNEQSVETPIVVIMNGNSASASEVFAGALQDYDKATIVGTTSYGKGIVQSVIPLSDGSAVKVTTSKYYTPMGRNIHEVGIEPDVEVELEESLKQKVVIEKEEDNQLQKAIEVLKDNN